MQSVTLIIPVHNGHKYIEQSINYYSNSFFDILYVDSTEKPYHFKSDKKNIKYLHMPGISFQKKLLSTIKKIQSQYVAVCAVDDFIVIDSLYQATGKMEICSKLIAFTGRYYAFYQSKPGLFFPLYKQKAQWKTGENKLTNVESFLKNYHMILWGVYRKSLLEEAYQLVCDLLEFIDNDNFIEFTLAVYFAYHGKIGFFDQKIWGVRELGQVGSWAQRSSENILNINTVKINKAKGVFSNYGLEEAFEVGYRAYGDFCRLNKDNIFKKVKRIIMKLSYSIKNLVFLNPELKNVKRCKSKYSD